MTFSNRGFLTILVICSLGMWGCSQNKKDALQLKVRDLEARYLKLEEDYRVVTASAESHRKRLAQVENQRSELADEVAKLKVVIKDRDHLKKQLATCANERDALHHHLVQFGKELQGLVGRIDAAALNPAMPSLASTTEETPAAVPAVSGKTF